MIDIEQLDKFRHDGKLYVVRRIITPTPHIDEDFDLMIEVDLVNPVTGHTSVTCWECDRCTAHHKHSPCQTIGGYAAFISGRDVCPRPNAELRGD